MSTYKPLTDKELAPLDESYSFDWTPNTAERVVEQCRRANRLAETVKWFRSWKEMNVALRAYLGETDGNDDE